MKRSAPGMACSSRTSTPSMSMSQERMSRRVTGGSLGLARRPPEAAEQAELAGVATLGGLGVLRRRGGGGGRRRAARAAEPPAERQQHDDRRDRQRQHGLEPQAH